MFLGNVCSGLLLVSGNLLGICTGTLKVIYSSMELALDRQSTAKVSTSRDSVSEQLTSARLSTGLGVTPGHKRYSSEQKPKESQVLILRPTRPQTVAANELWQEIELRLCPTNEAELKAEVNRLKTELRRLKSAREEERSGQLTLIGELEGQLQDLRREHLRLKSTLLSQTHSHEKIAAELQTAQLTALHTSAELQSLLLSKASIQDSVENLQALVVRLEADKAASLQESQELRATMNRLEEELKSAYTRIIALEEEKQRQEASRQLYHHRVGPIDLLTNGALIEPLAQSADTDLLYLDPSPPTLCQLLAEARRQITPPAHEVQTWLQRQKDCEVALSSSSRETRPAVELELLLVRQSLATAQQRQRV